MFPLPLLTEWSYVIWMTSSFKRVVCSVENGKLNVSVFYLSWKGLNSHKFLLCVCSINLAASQIVCQKKYLIYPWSGKRFNRYCCESETPLSYVYCSFKLPVYTTGLPTKDETSLTTVRNLYCLVSSYLPYLITLNFFLSLQNYYKRTYVMGEDLI